MTFQAYFYIIAINKGELLMDNYICDICGFVYDGEDFVKEPRDYRCPLCDQGKEAFHNRDFTREVKAASNEYYFTKNEG